MFSNVLSMRGAFACKVAILSLISAFTILISSPSGLSETPIVEANSVEVISKEAKTALASTGGDIPQYSVNHVIFMDEGLDLYTNGQWAPYVQPQDSFMLFQNNTIGFANQNYEPTFPRSK